MTFSLIILIGSFYLPLFLPRELPLNFLLAYECLLPHDFLLVVPVGNHSLQSSADNYYRGACVVTPEQVAIEVHDVSQE